MPNSVPQPSIQNQLISTPPWSEAAKSTNEEKAFNSKEYDKISLQKTEGTVSWLKHFHWITIVVCWIFVILFASSLVCWCLHYMLPTQWHWLSPDQLSKIQSVLFSGGMGAIVSSLLRQQLDKTK